MVKETIRVDSFTYLDYRQIEDTEKTIGKHVLLKVLVYDLVNSQLLVIDQDYVEDSKYSVENSLIQQIIVVETQPVRIVNKVIY